MRAAIEAARESKAAGDYAVGGVIVYESQVIAKAGNRTHLDCDPTQHAEIIAIRQAAQLLRCGFQQRLTPGV
jgi:tRNA(adenine34) deaminase